MTTIARALSLSLLIGNTLLAEYGCMDTSYHLAQLNDPKDYYVVTGADGGPCSCPCSKYCAQDKCSLAHGKCPVCMHYRVPRPYIIVSVSKESHELRPAAVHDHSKTTMFGKRIARKKLPQSQASAH